MQTQVQQIYVETNSNDLALLGEQACCLSDFLALYLQKIIFQKLNIELINILNAFPLSFIGLHEEDQQIDIRPQTMIMPIELHSNLNSLIPLTFPYNIYQQYQEPPGAMKKEEPTQITYIQYTETIAHIQPQTQINNIPSETNFKRRIFTGRKARSGYNWSDTENRQYLRFLMNNKGIFDLPLPQKKKIKTNVMLSKKIPTRNSTQCHTHHQKMVVKYGCVENIILELNKIYNIELGNNSKKQVFIKMEEDLDHIKIYNNEVKEEQNQSNPDVKLEDQCS